MVIAEMKTIRFSDSDVIATSGLSISFSGGTLTYGGKAYSLYGDDGKDKSNGGVNFDNDRRSFYAAINAANVDINIGDSTYVELTKGGTSKINKVKWTSFSGNYVYDKATNTFNRAQ